MTEFIDGARREIEARLALLRDEVKRLERAAAAIDGGSGGRRGPGRLPGSAARTAGRRGRGRRRTTRATQAERLVRRNPGITISDLAKRMKVHPAYLYRVMPRLQKDGKVRKRGREWHPA